jgi:hypothetical protein
MAEKNRVTLKSYFETGDRPTQENFADLVDSFVNRTDDPFVPTQHKRALCSRLLQQRCRQALTTSVM